MGEAQPWARELRAQAGIPDAPQLELVHSLSVPEDPPPAPEVSASFHAMCQSETRPGARPSRGKHERSRRGWRFWRRS